LARLGKIRVPRSKIDIVSSHSCAPLPARLPGAGASREGGRAWDQERWEHMVMNLIGLTMEAINDDEWTVPFGDTLARQHELYVPTSSWAKVRAPAG